MKTLRCFRPGFADTRRNWPIDVNPRKSGRFVPGGGQQIVEPNSLRELHPDVIILMNAIYRDEVASDIARLGLNPEILVA